MRFFSRLFGKNEDKQVEDMIAKINLIRDDENFQNMMLGDLMKDLIEENQGCDIIPGSEGDF
jgi:hypothetical protein